MAICGFSPCDAYLAAKQDAVRSGYPFIEQSARLKAACAVCWWGEQPQPQEYQRKGRKRPTAAKGGTNDAPWLVGFNA